MKPKLQKLQPKPVKKVLQPPPAKKIQKVVPTAIVAAKHEIKIPDWPFARRSETITQQDWPKIYKRIRDKAIKELDREIDGLHESITGLLNEKDALIKGGTAASQKLSQVTEIIKQLNIVLSN
jgi:hypothetical protein